MQDKTSFMILKIFLRSTGQYIYFNSYNNSLSLYFVCECVSVREREREKDFKCHYYNNPIQKNKTLKDNNNNSKV